MNGFNPDKINSPGKKERFVVQVEGQSIEGEKYYFEYPKHVQEETGILGYERVKISDEKLINIKEMTRLAQSDIINDLLVKLSGGEYPETCVTHTLGAYGASEKYRKVFAEDRFFIQKIYDLGLVEKLKDEMDPNHILNNNGAELEILNKKDNSPYSENIYGEIQTSKSYHEGVLHSETTPIAKIPKEILNNETEFYIKKDFYLEPGNFWTSIIGVDDIGFGFSVLDDSFFKKYIEECILVDHNALLESGNSSTKDIFCIYLINEYHRLGHSFSVSSSDDKVVEEMKRDFILKINEIASDFLKNKIPLSSSSSGSEINMGQYAKQRFFGRSGAFGGNYFIGHEIKMPIFINHDKIPQLSWGHAKYAHYFNDKSFNFFKFKHADHLPNNGQ